MDEIWDRLLLEGETKPIPPCWSGDDAGWREYQILAKAAPFKLRSHCQDCTPEFKNRNLGEGKCDRPETIFVLRKSPNREPEVVGLNRDSQWAFVRACRGVEGEIVHDAPKVAKSVALAICDVSRWGWTYDRQDSSEETDSGDDLLPPLPPDQGGVAAAGEATEPPRSVAQREDDGSPE